MSKTELQKQRRQSFSALPQGCELVLDEHHDVVVYRVSPKKWFVRFGEDAEYKERAEYSRKHNISVVMPKRVTAVVTRVLRTGPDSPAKEFMASTGGNITWHDALAGALEAAREWLVITDAAKRLRGG